MAKKTEEVYDFEKEQGLLRKADARATFSLKLMRRIEEHVGFIPFALGVISAQLLALIIILLVRL